MNLSLLSKAHLVKGPGGCGARERAQLLKAPATLLQGTQVSLLAPMWWLAAIHNSSSGLLNALF